MPRVVRQKAKYSHLAPKLILQFGHNFMCYFASKIKISTKCITKTKYLQRLVGLLMLNVCWQRSTATAHRCLVSSTLRQWRPTWHCFHMHMTSSTRVTVDIDLKTATSLHQSRVPSLDGRGITSSLLADVRY